jgi:hypothetical protein
MVKRAVSERVDRATQVHDALRRLARAPLAFASVSVESSLLVAMPTVRMLTAVTPQVCLCTSLGFVRFCDRHRRAFSITLAVVCLLGCTCHWSSQHRQVFAVHCEIVL